MFLLFDHLPPTGTTTALAVAHIAVLLDILTRPDLPWWRRLGTSLAVAALLPLGALTYLLARPTGTRMAARVARRAGRPAAHARRVRTGWRRTAYQLAAVVAIWLALAASLVTSAVAAPASPFAGRDYGVALLGLPQAWNTSTGTGVVVAVVDSGVDPTNAYLDPRLVPGHDFADSTGSTKDELGHGTHVAGIVAQTAPDALIMPVKVLDAHGAGAVAAIGKGVRWAADHGARVVNLSVDEGGILAEVQKEGTLNDAVQYANEHGAVVVTAAGNDGKRLQVYRSGVPAITVAAVDSDRRPAPFTNYGGPAEVAAGGVQVWSTAPAYPTTIFPDGTDGTAALDGTSMATPFVAGVAALLRSAGASTAATQAAILRTARPVSHTGVLGHGIVDAPAAMAYAEAHPHPVLWADFAPRWFRIVHGGLLAAVLLRYAWVGGAALGRRRGRPAVAAA